MARQNKGVSLRDRAGVPSGLSLKSQPKALIAYAESFGEYASMCHAGLTRCAEWYRQHGPK